MSYWTYMTDLAIKGWIEWLFYTLFPAMFPVFNNCRKSFWQKDSKLENATERFTKLVLVRLAATRLRQYKLSLRTPEPIRSTLNINRLHKLPTDCRYVVFTYIHLSTYCNSTKYKEWEIFVHNQNTIHYVAICNSWDLSVGIFVWISLWNAHVPCVHLTQTWTTRSFNLFASNILVMILYTPQRKTGKYLTELWKHGLEHVTYSNHGNRPINNWRNEWLISSQ